MQSGLLVIIRHGESEWNARGIWTGLTDVHLDAKGFDEAKRMGKLLCDIRFDHAFASALIRTQETLEAALIAANQADVPRTFHAALNERDYGVYTGKNKWEVKEQLGESDFNHLRRDWNYPVPQGETLEMVAARSVPYYQEAIAPLVAAGKNILVAAHGNSIRSLVQFIEDIPTDKIAEVEMIFGQALLYHIDSYGKQVDKSVRSIQTTPPPA